MIHRIDEGFRCGELEGIEWMRQRGRLAPPPRALTKQMVPRGAAVPPRPPSQGLRHKEAG